MAARVHIPEVFEPDEKLPADLLALRRFAWYMDEQFVVPGTRIRFGLDAVLGLIPGVGDLAGGLLSTWVIVGGLRHRVPLLVVLRMVANVLIDIFFGSIPVAGDLFDALFEVNMRNMRLLERHRDRVRPPRRTAAIAVTAGAIVAAIFVAAVVALVALLALLISLVGERPWF